MLLRQMKYYAAVVECDSFTEAAEQCYISQSAISQQIRSLEKELGVELIHRENRRFTVTPAGEYFYSHCKAVLEEVDDIVRSTRRLGRHEAPQLRIGYPRSYSGLELRQAIGAFSRDCPEVTIHAVTGTHEELYDLLRLGKADLVLNDQRRVFSESYVNFQLTLCDCCAELSPHNPLSARDALSLEELRRIPCILVSSREQRGAEQAYYQNTLRLGGSYLFADNPEQARLLVVGNRGFFPVERVGTLPPAGGSIRRLPIFQDGKPLRRNYCAFWRKGQPNGYVERFAHTLLGLLNQAR